jgi:hypothetical protein
VTVDVGNKCLEHNILSIDICFNSGYITNITIVHIMGYPIFYAHWRHLICIGWPEDGRNAVETCSQKLLNILALTIVYFIILLLCLTWNIYAYNSHGFYSDWASMAVQCTVIWIFIPRLHYFKFHQ